MPSVGEALAEAARQLEAATESPRLDAELLMAHALGCGRAQMLARLREPAPADSYAALVARRAAHEPVAYILGEWEFFSIPLYIERPVLVPRPETEHLVEVVLEEVVGRPARVLDLCTGSGCVAIAVALNAPKTRLTATDIAPGALSLARRNLARHGLEGRVSLYPGDLFAALPADTPPFDVVCSNPPYVEESAWERLSPDIRHYEDPKALLSGHEGLAHIRLLGEGAKAWLRPGGLLALEIGMGQEASVRRLLEGPYREVRFVKDLAGIARIALARA